ncbi:hypothetical protein BC938DRAFT_481173, partial [Jimgerdemannia flammicorona]
MNTDRNAHEHVLRTLSDLAVNTEEIRAFKSFEAEIVVVKITVVDYGRIELFGVRQFIGLGVHVGMKFLNDVGKRLGSFLVQIRNGYACRKNSIIGVLCRHVRGSFGCKVVELHGSNSL